jgi:CPA2 family monovalent cation:H+ antiporter-2
LVQRGEFSAIIASMAPAQLRVFSGIYIIITAFVGVYLFGRAPAIARWYDKRRKEKQAAMPAPEDEPKT